MEAQKRKKMWLDVSYAPLALGSIVTLLVTYTLYFQTKEILEGRLKERLISITSTAALQFSGEELNYASQEPVESNASYQNIINKMRAIRGANENLKFIYILKPTQFPTQFTFFADADSLAGLDEIDYNENGILDEDEIPPQYGDEYDATEIPIINDALISATADEELNSDQWGTFLSGYAPIKYKNGTTAAVIGIDVDVSDFNELVSATLLPFLLLTILLLALLGVMTIFLIRIWKNRVDIVEELDRQKDELLGIVSHQLAAPVTSLKWYLELMLDGDMGKLSKEQSEQLKGMRSIAQDLAELVNLILDVSRIQLGRIKIDRSEVDLNEFFASIATVIEPKAKEKNINFVNEVSGEMKTANIDRRLTRMTIENLLTNAVKYTPKKGEVKLTVFVKNGELQCTVSDTGIGIPPKDQSKIFGKLYRASNVVGKIDGNGFGLYIAKGAIESQGGKIWFESKDGKGTTFFVMLPIGNKK